MSRTGQPISRNLELEALRQAVEWPTTSPQVVLALVGQLLAAGRYEEGRALFAERAEHAPDQPLFAALAGVFQALAGQDLGDALGLLDGAVDRAPGLTNYFRGLILAQLPASLGKAEVAVADLELALGLTDQAGDGPRLPVGLRRGIYPALATAYTALGRGDDAQAARQRSGAASADPGFPALVTDWWMTQEDGFHFGPPRLVGLAPGVHVAQGFDFADVTAVETDNGIVLVDTTSSRAHLRAALAELRTVTGSAAPITHVILTHAHTDHIGGLDEVRAPGTEVIAQANFRDELRLQHASPPILFRRVDPSGAGRWLDVVPDRLVGVPQKLTIGGVDFHLYPISGGETSDGLVVHLPDRGVAIVGDMLTPQLGGPFFPEGSAEGLFEAMTLVEGLGPRLVIHGHTPLTNLFTIDVFPALAAALRDLHQHTLDAIRDGVALADVLARNHLPAGLRDHPEAVLPYLVMRDNLIKRVHHQRSGYWKPDGEGIEVFTAAEWAAALDLLGGQAAQAFVSAGEDLLGRGDPALALRLVESGLLRHPDDETLRGLRRRALYRLLERHQQLSPFKFAIYAAKAGVEVPPAP